MKTILAALFLSLTMSGPIFAHEPTNPQLEAILAAATSAVEEDRDFEAFLIALDPLREHQESLKGVIPILKLDLADSPAFKIIFLDNTGHAGSHVQAAIINDAAAFYFGLTYLQVEQGLRLIHFSGQSDYPKITPLR